MSRKLIVYIACSLDGYIAKPNDDLSFLNAVEREGEDYGYAAFKETIDTVILGRRTYDWVLEHLKEFHHPDKKAYVLTRQEIADRDNVVFYNGELSALVNGLKSEEGKDIFCDGGAQVVNQLLQEGLVDRLIISVIPVVVGGGTKLFMEGIPERELKLINSLSYESGLVQLQYDIL
ncbi:MAG: dihydrofolate reductase family protein [Flavobacteriaceae bacterium]|jgi:dihydrofolate reductase|nr:dihydrofolate reductase family protein [Flavobacteriaceae bacterium]